MLKSVRDVIIRSNEAYPEVERHQWVTEWPGQVSHVSFFNIFLVLKTH